MVTALAVITLPHGELRCPAVVDAARSFTLEAVVPGSYQWTLRDGRAPGGQSLIRQRVLQYEESDLVELRVDPALATGTRVSAGQTVAAISSLHTGRRLAELRAQRAALAAQRDLLAAGGLPEAVEQALRGVELAEAERTTGQADLERLRQLAVQGLTSAGELEVAELEDEVRRLRVVLARAGVEVARVPARAEALAAFDAQLAELDAGIAELARLLEEEQVLCPVDGIAEVGVGGAVVRVDQLEPVYLDIPIPVDARHRVREGAAVLFTTGAVNRTTFRGVLVEMATNADAAQGRPVFWASASIDNPDLLLRRGMTGTVLIPLDGEEFSAVARFRRKLSSPWRS